MKITEHLEVGLTQQHRNMHYLGFTFLNVVRGFFFGVDLLWFGFYVQITYRIKPSLTKVES